MLIFELHFLGIFIKYFQAFFLIVQKIYVYLTTIVPCNKMKSDEFNASFRNSIFSCILTVFLYAQAFSLLTQRSHLLQVAQRREKLLNYMLFLRVTPTLPNTFINVASPIVDVPYRIFFMATFIGLIPAAYVTVRVSFFLTSN